MPKCGACGYSKIDDSATHCPRCGEVLGGGSQTAPVVLENVIPAEGVEPTPAANESRQEKEGATAAVWERSPSAEQEVAKSADEKKALRIGGWLYIPAIHMIWDMSSELFAPLAFIFIVVGNFIGPYIEDGFGLYLGYWSTGFVIFASFSFTILAIRWVYVCILFFKKRINAPKAFADQFLARSVNYLIVGIWIGIIFLFEFKRIANEDYLNVIYVIAYAVFSFVLSKVYRQAFKKSERAKATFINPSPIQQLESGKIGGWLYIPAIHIVLQGAYAIYELVNMPEFTFFFKFIAIPWKRYHYLSFFDLVFSFAIVIVFILVGIMFMRKQSKAPIIFTILLFSCSLKNLLLPIAYMIMMNEPLLFTFTNIRNLVFFLCAAIVYAVAFRKSKRAKATFIN